MCTSELIELAAVKKELDKRHATAYIIVCDCLEAIQKWINDITKISHMEDFPFPIIDDSSREICETMDLLMIDENDRYGLPVCSNTTLIIMPNLTVAARLTYPTGFVVE